MHALGILRIPLEAGTRTSLIGIVSELGREGRDELASLEILVDVDIVVGMGERPAEVAEVVDDGLEAHAELRSRACSPCAAVWLDPLSHLVLVRRAVRILRTPIDLGDHDRRSLDHRHAAEERAY